MRGAPDVAECGAPGACLELHIGTRAGRVSAAAGARPDAPPSSSSNMSSNEARFCLGRPLLHSLELMYNKTRKQIHLAAFAAGTATSQAVVFTPKAKRYWGASNNAVITDPDLTGTTTTDFNSNASNSPLNIERINVTGSQYIFYR